MEPKAWRVKTLWIGMILFSFILFSGCASKEDKIGTHLERAKEYIQKNELKKALIELKNVVQLDPKNDWAHYELGEIYLKQKQGKEAFQAFSRAASANPDNLGAQLKMGQVYLLAKKTGEARKKAELILEKSPKDIKALQLLSGVQVQEKDTAAAIQTLEKINEIDPENFQTHLSLARLLFLKGDKDGAEKAYSRAISLSPSSRVPYVELSRIYVGKGQWDKAEEILKKMIQSSDAAYRSYHLLAGFYESRNQWSEAEEAYQEAVKSAPKGEVAPLMNLGTYYARRSSYDQALDAMKKAMAIKPDDENILLGLADLHLGFNKIEDAELAVGKVLEKDAGNVQGNYIMGRILLTKRNFTGAYESFDLVTRESPRNGRARYFKALSLFGKNEPERAKQELVQAVELAPLFFDARMLLAELYLRERNKELAREQIDAALKLSPDNFRVHLLLGTLKLLEKDNEGAEAALKRVVELKPDYAPGYASLGAIYLGMRRIADAQSNLERALEVDPYQINALNLICGIYIREKKYSQAWKICEAQKKKVSDRPASVAQIEYLQGNIMLVRKDTKKAQAHFEKALETEPNLLAPYTALARIYISERRLDEAIEQYEAVIKKSPNFLGGYMALGTIYDYQGERDKAETYYRKAMEIKPDFAPAANNLAWSLAERGGNIDEALKFAQIAKENIPKNASVMDTLGWIYYLKGSYLNAVSELHDSVELQPDNPVINYHLGMAYYKQQNREAAQEFLQKALQLDQNFKGAGEARKILEEIKNSSSSK